MGSVNAGRHPFDFVEIIAEECSSGHKRNAKQPRLAGVTANITLLPSKSSAMCCAEAGLSLASQRWDPPITQRGVYFRQGRRRRTAAPTAVRCESSSEDATACGRSIPGAAEDAKPPRTGRFRASNEVANHGCATAGIHGWRQTTTH